MKLELLAPAKNYEQGIAAINHGADALYIGAPSFGARIGATNTISDIERLVRYAHIYHSKIFATVNTLLFDNEIEEAVKMCHQLYEVGVDALIIQDMGLLECDLPPIELHASTQTHNYDLRRIKFLEQIGFHRIILARETSLEQMATIRKETHVALEAFVQGALCVSYSGQCYLSQYLNGRSGNRGCCSQPCRSSYNLLNDSGKTLRHNEHLLSLKDFSAAQYIDSMIAAGISSFKIEGRLKDLSYVKNVTAYYRKLLDNYLIQHSEHQAASSGHCTFGFEPDLEKTFNRGFTTYFLKERKPMASFSTPKSMGKEIGSVKNIDSQYIEIKPIDSHVVFTAGDGLCYLNQERQLEGFFVNHVQGNRIVPNRMPESLQKGIPLWRNNDFAFEKHLQGNTAQRKIDIKLILSDTKDGLRLYVKDEDECEASCEICCEKTAAINPEKAKEQIIRQLSKLGESPFSATDIENQLSDILFIPASTLNELRRNVIELLIVARTKSSRQIVESIKPNDAPYFEESLNYKGNVINQLSEQFYRRHGVKTIEKGVEKTLDYKGKALMTTRYCLRYELGQCLHCKNNDHIDKAYQGSLILENNGQKFLLNFDCSSCQMSLFAI